MAGVPFKPLSAYDRKVVHGYVGSMYGYAKDIALKNAPEDFVYHVPRDVTYTATYTDYTIDRNYRVVGEGRPRRGIYFQHYRDGSAGADDFRRRRDSSCRSCSQCRWPCR